MKVGVILPSGLPGVTAGTLKQWIRGIDGGPFSTIGVADRIAYPNHDSMLTMAMAAGLSERAQIMSLVTLPALRPRVLFAKEVATLSQMAPGRLTIGIGPGARRTDYEAVGGDWTRRGRTLDDHLDQLVTLRTPSSDQQLGPVLGDVEILVGGASPAALRRMVTHGHGYVGGGLRPDIFAFEAAAAGQAWAAAGRSGRPRLVASTWFSRHLDVDDETARRLDHYLLQGGPPAAVRSAIARGTDGIHEAVRDFRAQGADEVVFFAMDDDITQLEWLADVVRGMPEQPLGEPTPDYAAMAGADRAG